MGYAPLLPTSLISLGGDYHSLFVLVPTYNIGFTLLTAGNEDVRNTLLNSIVDNVLPVIDQIARDQASSRFAGHYTSSQGNSSLTVTTEGHQTGLKITQWISNGVDIFGFFKEVVPNIAFRLLPNQLLDGDGKVGFTSYYMSATPPPANGTWLFNCPGWFDVDELTYGNIPLGQMVFNVSGIGKATAVDLRALRTTLKRSS